MVNYLNNHTRHEMLQIPRQICLFTTLKRARDIQNKARFLVHRQFGAPDSPNKVHNPSYFKLTTCKTPWFLVPPPTLPRYFFVTLFETPGDRSRLCKPCALFSERCYRLPVQINQFCCNVGLELVILL